MREQFIEWKPKPETLTLLQDIQGVITYFKGMDLDLSLRQLYYQLVARDLVPNTLRSYKRVGEIVSRARLSGMIDWRSIEDRVRTPSSNQHWDSPKQILEAAASGYYKDHWEDQPHYVEVWSEKDAVSNIIKPICRKWDVTFLACRGYNSQTAMYKAYGRYKYARSREKQLVLIYVGDHDPSGLDMTRDIEDRMGLFLHFSGYLSDEPLPFEDVDRIALNMDQVLLYKPPENPTKITDSRAKEYIRTYGQDSWELDALDPKVLGDLVDAAISQYVDMDVWDEVEDVQEAEKARLLEIAEEEYGDDA